MNKEKDFLGKEPIGKLLFKLAIPTVIAQFINMLYNIVDRIYIGHIKGYGSLALTGVGVSFPIIIIVSAFVALICNGGAPLASINLGKKDIKKANKIFNNCFILQVIVAIVITVVVLIYSKDILLLFGASNNTIKYAKEYIDIYILGTLFAHLSIGMSAFMTAQGYTKISMYTVVLGAITNILLDPIFIFTFGMGVKGAALASILSQLLSCIFIMIFILKKKGILILDRKYFRLEFSLIKFILGLGISGFVIQSSESLIMIAFNASLLKYGGDIAVGAMAILSSIMQLILLPLNGIGQGAQPILSYNYGANKIKRVKETFKLLTKVSLIYSLTLWILVMIFPQIFISLFTNDNNLINFSIKALRIYILAVGAFGVQVACQFTFNALGNAKASIMVAVTRKIILLIPLIYILPTIILENKTKAVYMAEPLADFLSIIFTLILFYNQWKKYVIDKNLA